jgi:CHASE1-domain containing sensor protein
LGVEIEPCSIDRKLRNWGEGMKHRQMIHGATTRGDAMAKNPTAEEAIERARALQDSKIDAVRRLADASQNVSIARERAGAAERDYTQTFSAALSAGWTPDELRKIGFVDADKKTRASRRAKPKSTPMTTPEASE